MNSRFILPERPEPFERMLRNHARNQKSPRNTGKKPDPTPYTRPTRRSSSIVATDEEYDEFLQDERSYNGSQLCLRRIQQNLALICAKYNRSYTMGEADVIDMNSLTIIKDNGIVRALPDRDVYFGRSLALPDPIDPAFSQPLEEFTGEDEPDDADSLDEDDDRVDVNDDISDGDDSSDAENDDENSHPVFDEKSIQNGNKETQLKKLQDVLEDPVSRLSAMFGRPLLHSPSKNAGRSLINSPANTPPNSPLASRKVFYSNCRN